MPQENHLFSERTIPHGSHALTRLQARRSRKEGGISSGRNPITFMRLLHQILAIRERQKKTFEAAQRNSRRQAAENSPQGAFVLIIRAEYAIQFACQARCRQLQQNMCSRLLEEASERKKTKPAACLRFNEGHVTILESCGSGLIDPSNPVSARYT